jgi:hypothetical protein
MAYAKTASQMLSIGCWGIVLTLAFEIGILLYGGPAVGPFALGQNAKTDMIVRHYPSSAPTLTASRI